MNGPISLPDAIGGTPLIRLGRLGAGLAAPLYAKVEFLNIGGSVKDRAALSMVRQAEQDGLLQPGGTIVEATSGNTGIGLAIIGRRRGYRVIVGVSDRSAPEKSAILRAYGAEVVRAATRLPKQHPDHLERVMRRVAEETPGAWFANQYDNQANPAAHLHTTGPEIWQQTEGRVTHFVAGIGTGGTISGAGRFLKEASGGKITVVAADPRTSAYSGGEGSAYFVESIGRFVHPQTDEDRWPQAYHPEVVDRFEQIPDRDSLLTTRLLAREEGLLAGPSSGTATAAALRVARTLGPDDLVVVLLPDSGRSYLSTVFSDDWMVRTGFLEQPDVDDAAGAEPTARQVFDSLPDRRTGLVTVSTTTTAGSAAAILSTKVVPVVLARPERRHGINSTEILGSLDLGALRAALSAGRIDPASPVSDHLAAPLPTVGVGSTVSAALTALGSHPAVIVLRDGRATALLTRADLNKAATGGPQRDLPPSE
ncbi:putative cystathionine beta-synthase MT1108 [Frankia sp. AiPs1]|uniref:pyridoxal-phosphate dependent enzyme n=1 Tax=Frankia sp. AiPa1 TaxID=573492 RepID=UPI00202B794F|nr:pyridoxal-phosphate dependent enzyme [Frankia sp. AiPa1]MCL9759849.1 pyridoxal-phosphate dependent enzyme [Frankia sp. AiPa1]